MEQQGLYCPLLNRNRTSAWLLVILLGCSLPWLGACGSQEQTVTGGRHIQVSATPAPEKGQVLHREVSAQPGSLDPSLATDVPAMTVLEDLFEGLTTIDQAGTPVPGVASSWQISADSRTWTFHLRENARWSNGAPVTAQDFLYAWHRQVDPATASQYAQALTPIVNAMAIAEGKMPVDRLGVEAPDAHTLVVHLVQPTPYFLWLLTNQYLYPLYQPAIAKWGESWTQPGHMISNGAFEMTGMVINGHITLERNPYYWDARHVRLREVVYSPLSDASATVSQYLAGDLDFTDQLPGAEKDMLQRELGNQVIFAPYFGTAMLSFNLTKPPFQNNPSLRLALNLALDREPLATYVQRGTVLPAYNLVPPLPGYQPEVPAWAKWPDAQRHARARQLYREAGYSEAHPLETVLTYPSGGAGARRFMEAVAAMWQMNLGAKIQIYNVEWKVFLQSEQMKQPTVYWSAWIGDFPDPFTFMQLYQTGFGQNNGGYSNSRFDALITEANGTENLQDRYRLFAQAGAILTQEAPYVPMFYYTSAHLIKPYLKGWTMNTMNRNLSQYMYILAHTEQ